MLVIFGTTVIGKVVKSGSFYCPRCNMERGYQVKQNEKYFSLFFIPLIPIGKSGDTLACSFCKTSYIPSSILSEEEYTSSTIATDYLEKPLASPGKRIGSYVVDMLILILLNFPLAILAGHLPHYFDDKFYLLFFPMWIIYFFIMEWLLKGTIGKKIFSIEITSDKEGHQVTITQYLLRSIIKCIPLINIIFLFNDKRKGVHDYLAKTLVSEK